MKYYSNAGFNGIGLILLLALLVSFFATVQIYGQEPPPRPVTVTPTPQGLSFGSFSQGVAGGTVTVPASGLRSSSGDVILLNMTPSYSPAIFDVVGNPGTLVSILVWPAAVLTGPGGTMTLQVNTLYPTPFVITTTPPLSTLMYIGGVLTVGNPGSNPPGLYSGTFNITFVQE
jgi:hypothetical protein